MDIAVLDFLNSIIPISENLKIRLDSILRTAEFKKKTVLLKEGQLSNYIYFIESGLMRIYREKSDEFIETIEDTRAQYISFEELERLYADFPEFNIVGRRLITQYYVKSEERNFLLRKQTAQEKFQFFQKHFGHLTSRVQRKDIASYIGINLETLSRL